MSTPSTWQPTRSANETTARRALRNLIRIPQRTWHSLTRRFDPQYQLQRQADADVRGWVSAQRQCELETIPGMSSPRECRLLAHLAAHAPAGGDIVEIGAWMGRSTAWLVEGAQRHAVPPAVFSIDPHERESWATFQQTVSRFQLVERGLVIHRAYSHEIGKNWQRPISLLWVDGCHEYEPVCQDIADFAPHVLPGGWVVFDDAGGGVFPGVERAIAERMTTAANFQHIATIRHLAIFRRHTA